MTAICVAEADQIRHKRTLRSRDLIEVTLYPDDGRFPESFRLSAAELRRFAWAVLADFDPIEARAAASEDGLDLDAMAAPVRLRQPSAKRAVRRPAKNAIVQGDERHRVLADFGRRGVLRLDQIEARIDDGSDLRSVVDKLRRVGFLDRASESLRRARAKFHITEAGREELTRLAERRAA